MNIINIMIERKNAEDNLELSIRECAFVGLPEKYILIRVNEIYNRYRK